MTAVQKLIASYILKKAILASTKKNMMFQIKALA